MNTIERRSNKSYTKETEKLASLHGDIDALDSSKVTSRGTTAATVDTIERLLEVRDDDLKEI